MRQALRVRHHIRRTEEFYLICIKCFILLPRHPAEMPRQEINAFLTRLAPKQRAGASTGNQGLSALLFLYRHVLGQEVGELGDAIRARRPKRRLVILTRDEAKAVLAQFTDDGWLMASLGYSAGLRSMDCLPSRVEHLDSRPTK
jgi:integrase